MINELGPESYVESDEARIARRQLLSSGVRLTELVLKHTDKDPLTGRVTIDPEVSFTASDCVSNQADWELLRSQQSGFSLFPTAQFLGISEQTAGKLEKAFDDISNPLV